MSEYENHFKLNVHPNPFDASIRINIDKTNEKNLILRIMDVSGSVLKTVAVSDGLQTLNLDTSDLPSGIFILSISNNEKQSSVKIVK